MGQTSEEWAETLKDGWIDRFAVLFGELRDNFNQINPDYKIEYSEDYRQVDMYYNLELDAAKVIYYVMYVEMYCVCEQFFYGTGEDEWKITFNIYNSDTGKLVTTGDSYTGLEYHNEDWLLSL